MQLSRFAELRRLVEDLSACDAARQAVPKYTAQRHLGDSKYHRAFMNLEMALMPHLPDLLDVVEAAQTCVDVMASPLSDEDMASDELQDAFRALRAALEKLEARG